MVQRPWVELFKITYSIRTLVEVRMMKKQHYMTAAERFKLEAYLEAGKSVSWIAKIMGFCRQTIYNEIKRGTYLHTVKWWDEKRYSAAKGQMIYQKAQRNKGRPLKIGNDIAYANFLEHKILHDRFSPAAALALARKEGYTTCICVNTFYNYITQGVFYQLTNSDLLEKTTRKPREKKGRPKIAHKNLPNIAHRPDYINLRMEHGHWEMDLVVGPQASRACLLTLTERVTRAEIIIKLPNRKAATVRRALNRLERNTPNFREKFKSITTDNGPEFMEYHKLIKSIYGGKRFSVYYCHSYAAWEKGCNENHNRMIRRWFPKGTAFEKVSKAEIAAVQDWMNSYPRKILGWASPAELAA